MTSRGAAAYEYTLRTGGKLSEYNMEQQGEIISDYYMICVENVPRSVWNRNKDRDLLATTLSGFIGKLSDKSNLPD